LQKDSIKDKTNFYLIIHGENDQTEKLYLKDANTSDKKSEFHLKTIDVGKVR
jgi:hypothetical protein